MSGQFSKISSNRIPIAEQETVTLADVALLAGVSTMTVSKVLRGIGSISAETRQSVFESVRSLGYVQTGLPRR